MSKKANTFEYRIRRVRTAAAEKFHGYTISGPDCVAAALCNLLGDRDRETFVTLYLSAANKVIGYEITAVGSLSSVEVHPREVFKGAILAGAAAVIVAHNHPSGNCTPSREDEALTQRLKDAGALLGIPLLDSLVVTEDQHHSIMH